MADPQGRAEPWGSLLAATGPAGSARRFRLVVTLVSTSVILLIAGPPALAQEPNADRPPGAGEGTTEQAAPGEPRASLPDIEDEVMCPICGTALNLSESPQAEQERAFIRRLIAAGQTKEEIKDALVVEYGRDVLATPDTQGFDLMAWIVPGGGIAAAVLALGFGIGRWRRSGRNGPAAGEASTTLDSSEEERLDSDLARYDL